ncbi:MAG: ABC transporter permease [Acidobacteriaceae bacterium]|nr:ABC transporter permease [Acidobacteriaceae bacterium]
MEQANRAGDGSHGNLARDFGKDLIYALRTLRKAPVFAVFVVLTLGLAIGANTTVFTVINTLLLNPLPVPKSSELVSVNAAKLGTGAKAGAPLQLSYADFKDIESGETVFSSLAAYSSPRGATWQAGNGSQGLFAELVTGNYFQTLGLQPARGNFFSLEDDSAPGAHPVAVINYGTWQQRFGGDPAIIGKTLLLNHVELTVIGVAPQHFIGVSAIFGPDLWIPTAMAKQLFPTEMANVFEDRGKSLFEGIGRLRPGILQGQARANLSKIASGLAREYPATDEGRTATVQPVRDVLFANNGASSGSVLYGSVGLLVVVGVVLLIACSNVANLLLARTAGRRHEMAVRLAMGARRGRLLRLLLTESILLGSLSGATGVLFAYAALRLLFHVLPSGANFVVPKFDATVFLFALIVSLLTGLLFGALPALRATDVPVGEMLKEEARIMGRSRRKVTLANALLSGQVAFSFLLLLLAGLFLRSIGRAYTIDPGFQTAHLAIFMTSPGQAGYNKPRTKAFYKDVRERVSTIRGVESASWASNLPLWERPTAALEAEGYEKRSRTDAVATIVNTVDRDYFDAAGVAMDRGRPFTEIDRENSTPVAIVNEKIANDYWPGQDPVGKRIRLAGEQEFRQVIGVAKNANYTNWGEAAQPCLYIPLEQKYSDGMALYVRTRGNPREALTPIQQEFHAMAPQVKISVLTGPELIRDGLFFARTGVALLSVFGFLALGLASIGLYGILAYEVAQRRREVGLRMALGAGRRNILRLIVWEGMSLAGAGVLIGLAGAVAVARLLTRFLYGISGGDPLSVLGAAMVLSTVAFLACYLPARRASRVDPLVALREG